MLVRREPADASAIRARLAAELGHRGIDPDVIDSVVLVATELVGNAIRHTDAQRMGVSWDVGQAEVVVAVDDSSAALPVAREAPIDADSGRGLRIVAALARAWGVERTAGGKRVWAAVPLA